ncbi:hypothetical protein ACT7C8_01665 [Bacillus cereus]
MEKLTQVKDLVFDLRWREMKEIYPFKIIVRNEDSSWRKDIWHLNGREGIVTFYRVGGSLTSMTRN